MTACGPVSYLKSTSSQDKKEMKSYLKTLKDVALNKHYTELMALMDADYLKEQHEYFLKGNDLQFVNEIFCGNDINDNTFHCIKQQDISYFETKKIEQIEDTKYNALFIVGDNEHKVACKLIISKKVVNNQIILGIVGAIG